MKFSNVIGIVALVALILAASYIIVSEKEVDAASYDSGEAVVEDLNAFLKDTIGDDFVVVTYTAYDRIDIKVDPAYFSELSADTSVIMSEAFDLVKQYDLVKADGVVYVQNGMPQYNEAMSGIFNAAAVAMHSFDDALPGEINVYIADSVTIVKKGCLPFNGTVYFTVDADQKTIDFVEYVEEYVDLDPETQTVIVDIEAFGIDEESSIKEVIGDVRGLTAAEFFDEEFSDMINTVFDKVNRLPKAVDMFSFSWEKDGKAYKAAIKDFQPGKSGDSFQKFTSGLYDSMYAPAGYNNGWNVEVGDFKDPVTGEYVFNGNATVTYVGEAGDVHEASVPLAGNVVEGERAYDISIVAPEHGSIILVPGISGNKVGVKVIPDDGYELKTLTVTMNGETTDITETMYFELVGDASLDAVFVKPVTGIQINPAEMEIEVGSTATITVTVLPDDATDKSVVWTTSNAEVATVDGGVVTGVSAGVATVTVTTVDKGLSVSCEVTVVAHEPPVVVKVTGVKLSSNSLSMKVGDSKTLVATVSPADATDKGVSWTTSNPSVATVSNGVVKAVASGNATITVTTDDGSFTDTCSVTVESEPAPAKDNTLLYVGIVIAIIVILLVAFLLMRSKSKS
jgi:uncharacterized protein YjdB